VITGHGAEPDEHARYAAWLEGHESTLAGFEFARHRAGASDSPDVLTAPAAEGRTRRVRTRAAHRRARLGSRIASEDSR